MGGIGDGRRSGSRGSRPAIRWTHDRPAAKPSGQVSESCGGVSVPEERPDRNRNAVRARSDPQPTRAPSGVDNPGAKPPGTPRVVTLTASWGCKLSSWVARTQ